MGRKRIAIEAQRIFRKKRHGMDMVALELIKNLMLIDKENQYFIFVAPGQERTLHSEGNFEIVELKGGPYPTWEQIALPRAVKKYGCDLLHCTSNTAPLYCNRTKVITLHDIIYLESFTFFKRGATLYQRFGNLYRRAVVPQVIKRSESIVTVSHFEKERIGKMLQIEEKLSAIYNGVGEHFRPIEESSLLESCRERYNLPKKFLLFLGNTDPKKNSLNLLKAFAHFSKRDSEGYHLVIIDYKEETLLSLLREIDERELRKKITLLGYVPNSELPQIINLATLFLYPSLRESFGIPILEGMSCGVAVLTSNSSSMPEVAGGAALLVEPESYLSIAEGIEKLIGDEKLRDQLIEKGLKRASQFSWLEMAKNYLKLYNRLLN